MEKYYWQLPDGNIWSFVDGGFIGLKPDSEAVQPVRDLADLRARIVFYGGALGKLATRFDHIKAVQEKYRSGLAELDAAYLSAQIDGDHEAMVEIAEEKQALRAAMAAEIKAIQEEK